MKVKRLYIVSMAASMLMLNGCFKTEAPQCSSEEVTGMVQQIYGKHMKDMGEDNILAQVLFATVPKKISKIDSARAVSYDENIHLRSCKAQAYFESNTTAPIEYTVQLDEKDSDQIYVELKMDFVEDLAQQGMMNQIMKNMK